MDNLHRPTNDNMYRMNANALLRGVPGREGLFLLAGRDGATVLASGGGKLLADQTFDPLHPHEWVFRSLPAGVNTLLGGKVEAGQGWLTRRSKKLRSRPACVTAGTFGQCLSSPGLLNAGRGTFHTFELTGRGASARSEPSATREIAFTATSTGSSVCSAGSSPTWAKSPCSSLATQSLNASAPCFLPTVTRWHRSLTSTKPLMATRLSGRRQTSPKRRLRGRDMAA